MTSLQYFLELAASRIHFVGISPLKRLGFLSHFFSLFLPQPRNFSFAKQHRLVANDPRSVFPQHYLGFPMSSQAQVTPFQVALSLAEGQVSLATRLFSLF